MAPASYADLLIIGAGPAGLMAACWAAQFDMSTQIIDEKSGRTRTGHADGIHSRTLEILESFGVVDPILRQGVHDVEMCYWLQNKESGNIERQKRLRLQPEGLSRYGQTLLNQGLVEQLLIDYLHSESHVRVEWGKRAVELEIYASDGDGRQKEYPVTVGVRRVGCESDDWETIHARYLIACDGAHSWTREQLRVPSDTQNDCSTWGVIDIVPITDFPDIRQSCAIHSGIHGSIMTAPRENRLVRLYIQLKEAGEEVKRQGEHSPRALVELAEQTMKPYYLTYKLCDWWSLYPVGQRLVNRYRVHERVFLAGDAAHTHSPKGGQGMNVSIQDTYNLVWKLASVISGGAVPDILETYDSERRPVAEELIEMDHRLVNAYQKGLDEVEKVRGEYAGFMTGVHLTYRPSPLVSSGDTSTAKHIYLGMRLPSFPVTCQADASCVQLAETLRSNGSWKLIVFPGDIRQPDRRGRLNSFADELSGWSRMSGGSRGKCSPEIRMILVHSSPRASVDFVNLPYAFRPFDETLGYDYWGVYADDCTDGKESGQAYKGYGICDSSGCLVLCRPDQHVAWTGRMDELVAMDHFLSRFSGNHGYTRTIPDG